MSTVHDDGFNLPGSSADLPRWNGSRENLPAAPPRRAPDHLLHFKPTNYGGWWRLECLPHGEHFTADTEEWSGTADELEAAGITIDRETCWVHGWLDNVDAGHCLVGDDWPENGPWPVTCTFDDVLRIEHVDPS